VRYKFQGLIAKYLFGIFYRINFLLVYVG